jgi:hypothetical protein
MDRNDPVKVYEAWNSVQSEFVCNLLRDAGISARVASDAVQNIVGRVPFQKATCPIWVAAADIDRAREVVAEYDRRLVDHSQGEHEELGSLCYHCGHGVEQGQSPCPRCGLELDWSEE